MNYNLPNVNCPYCEKVMKHRIKYLDHINKKSNILSKHRYFQYYCEDCDNDTTGWTTTESDTMSEQILKNIRP